jgi:hypothetical protein
LRGDGHLNLEELISERNYVLGELRTYEELQLALEKIERFDMENFAEITLKVYDTSNDPEMEEITETVAAVKIDEITDHLLKLSDSINKLKIGEDPETS